MLQTKLNKTKTVELNKEQARGNIAICQLDGTIGWPFSKSGSPITVKMEICFPETGQKAYDLAVKDFSETIIQPKLKDIMTAIGHGIDEFGKVLEEINSMHEILTSLGGLESDIAWTLINGVAPKAMAQCQGARAKDGDGDGAQEEKAPIGDKISAEKIEDKIKQQHTHTKDCPICRSPSKA